MRASGGRRIEWPDVAPTARRAVEEAIGAAVVEAVNEAGGFSPGLAARTLLDDGRRVFIKAVSADQNPHAPRIHRREAEVAAQLPPAIPAPPLLHVHDDGQWVVLVFDEVDGRQPCEPWEQDELATVCRAIERFAVDATPCPIDVQPAADKHRAAFGGWGRALRDGIDRARLDPWVAANLTRLADLERNWQEAMAGDSLVHADLRADNVLLAGDRIWFVDWPWACRGASFVDLVLFLPSTAIGGGPPPWETVHRLDLFAGDDDDAITCVLATLASMLVVSSLDPPPPGLPNLRRFQAAQGEVAVAWLRRRIDRG